MNYTSVNRLASWMASLLLPCLSALSAWGQSSDVTSSMQLLDRSLMMMNMFYVDSVNTDQLAETAVRAMLKELDPHSTYLTPEEVRAMHENLGGNFEGIGVRYQMENDTLLIINTVEGGPSKKVGILAGDRIITVDSTCIAGQGISTDKIQKRLRGPKGSHVSLGIKRPGEKELITFDVERDVIPVYSVDAKYMIAPTIGYVKISRFAETTFHELIEAMIELTRQGMTDLIIDLQDNGGGYLNTAANMADIYLIADELVVYTQGRNDDRHDYRTHVTNGTFKGRLVVLVDEQSASASEIFAGCMQDLDRGVIVGRRSFGKGLVQRPVELPNGGMVRLTTSHYYTPSGRCIQKPYTKGDQKSYEEDLINRLHSGELVSADSIHLADSLRFYTRNGRTVYGGGGIMPDVFVPLDTSRITPAHRDVIARSSFNRFVIQYFKEHVSELHKRFPTLQDFAGKVTKADPYGLKSGFVVTPTIIDSLICQARRDGVATDSLETLHQNDLFKLQFKAQIGNDLYEMGAYYCIMNRQNRVVQEGLNVILDKKRYKTLLEPAK